MSSVRKHPWVTLLLVLIIFFVAGFVPFGLGSQS